MTTQAPVTLEQGYRSMREGAAFVDRPAGPIEVTGPDAAEFLQGQVTNDIAALTAGEGCYALLLNPKGKILADMRLLVRPGGVIWLLSEQLDTLLAALERYRIGRQVDLSQRAMAIMSVIGPRSRKLVELPDHEHSSVEAELGGARVVAVATDLGVDLMLEAHDQVRLEEHLVAEGAEPATEEAAEIVRVETGRPRYGVDMTDQNLPGELGLEARAVSFTKGCYVGQEPVARMHYKGRPNRHLRGLELTRPASRGDTLRRGGNEVGTVTSACVSPALGSIALALVRREVGPGEPVECGDGKTQATVVELPFQSAGRPADGNA